MLNFVPTYDTTIASVGILFSKVRGFVLVLGKKLSSVLLCSSVMFTVVISAGVCATKSVKTVLAKNMENNDKVENNNAQSDLFFDTKSVNLNSNKKGKNKSKENQGAIVHSNVSGGTLLVGGGAVAGVAVAKMIGQ